MSTSSCRACPAGVNVRRRRGGGRANTPWPDKRVHLVFIRASHDGGPFVAGRRWALCHQTTHGERTSHACHHPATGRRHRRRPVDGRAARRRLRRTPGSATPRTTTAPAPTPSRARWSSATAAPRATGPSTPSPATTSAIRMGADVIEPDLVSTKDGVLVARHENEISGTTDVAGRPGVRRPQDHQDDRRHRRSPAGSPRTSPSRELKTLRAKERLPAVRQENTIYDGRYQVPTLPAGDRPGQAGASRRTAGRSASRPRPSTRPTSTPSGCRSRSRCVQTLRAQRPRPAAAPTSTCSRSRRPTCASCADRLPPEGRAAHERRRDGAAVRPRRRGDPETYAQMTTPAGLREVATLRRRARAGQGADLPARRRRQHRARRPRWWPTRTTPA